MVQIDLVDVPTRGRIFRRERRVRLGDVTPTGRARFDALARYLQDIARDDSADSALENPMGWVVRRTAIHVDRWPVFQEHLGVATWCSGIGARWAERRTSIVGEQGGAVESASLWVHVDPLTGRPARLVAGFADRYAEAASGRNADAKLVVPADPPPDATRRPWPLRHTDFDVLGHVNNAAYWNALEQLLGDTRGCVDPPVFAVVEHRLPLAPGAEVALVRADPDERGGYGWWLTAAGATATAGWFAPGVS